MHFLTPICPLVMHEPLINVSIVFKSNQIAELKEIEIILKIESAKKETQFFEEN